MPAVDCGVTLWSCRCCFIAKPAAQIETKVGRCVHVSSLFTPVDLMEPLLHVLEAVPVSHIVHDYNAMCASVVCKRKSRIHDYSKTVSYSPIYEHQHQHLYCEQQAAPSKRFRCTWQYVQLLCCSERYLLQYCIVHQHHTTD